MIRPAIPNPDPGSTRLVVIDVGNSSVKLGVWDAGNVTGVATVATRDESGFESAFDTLCSKFEGERPAAVVIASVVADAVGSLGVRVREIAGLDARVVGHDLPLPISVDVRSPETVGVDRVCAAAAAFDRTGHACIVVDFGTAITVDLVGDNGVFLGGAILPGPRLQLAALHEHTAALPDVEPSFPPEHVGNDTEAAMCIGVCNGIVGAARELVECFATHAGKWPQVVATGGDLEFFAPKCDFLDSLVPNLCLMGIGLAWVRCEAKAE